MTDQPAGPPPYDPAHPSVTNQVPAWLFTGRHKGPDGDLLICTIRVPNATVTAVMTKQDAQKWIKQLQNEVDQMSSFSLAPAHMPMPSLGPFDVRK